MYREEGPGGHSRFFLSHLKTAYSISTSRHALAVLFHPQNEKYSQPSHLRNSDIDIRCRVLLPFLAFRDLRLTLQGAQHDLVILALHPEP